MARGPGQPMVYTLAADRQTFLDTTPELGASNCYTIVAFNEFGRSGPGKVCIDVPANSDRATDTPEVAGPVYVPGPSLHTVVDTGAGERPRLPAVRIYKAYEPWGEPGVEDALLARGYIHGESLFVHPIEDLVSGVPAKTVVVIVPSASDGNEGGQVRWMNAPRARRGLRNFVLGGGVVILHRWSDGGPVYRVPVKGRASSSRWGYQVFDAGDGAAYATSDPVDHPLAGVLGRNLDRLLESVLHRR